MERRTTRVLGLGILALAALLTVLGVPVTSAQGLTLQAGRAEGELPMGEPFDPRWEEVAPVEVPLSGQIAVIPPRLEPSVAAISVRAMVDDERLAILLEWSDATRDDATQPTTAFADAVAMQFGLGEGASICMGQRAGGLNIWHWKADWAADLAEQLNLEQFYPNMPRDPQFGAAEVAPGSGQTLGPEGFYAGRDAGNPRSAATRPSAVEDLNAIGFGTLTPQPVEGQNVHGASAWRDGVWRVVMSRELRTSDPNDAQLARRSDITVAFAIWDGARGDRDGQKSVSSWLALSIPARPMTFLDMWPFWLLLSLALALAGAVIWVGSHQPAVGLGGPGVPR